LFCKNIIFKVFSDKHFEILYITQILKNILELKCGGPGVASPFWWQWAMTTKRNPVEELLLDPNTSSPL